MNGFNSLLQVETESDFNLKKIKYIIVIIGHFWLTHWPLGDMVVILKV